MVARTGAPNRTDNFKRKSFQVYSPEVNIGEVYFLKKIPSEMEVALLNKDAWQKCMSQKCTKHQLVLLNIFKFSGSKNANKS